MNKILDKSIATRLSYQSKKKYCYILASSYRDAEWADVIGRCVDSIKLCFYDHAHNNISNKKEIVNAIITARFFYQSKHSIVFSCNTNTNYSSSLCILHLYDISRDMNFSIKEAFKIRSVINPNKSILESGLKFINS